MKDTLKALLNAVREWLGWLIVVKIARRLRIVSWFEFELRTPDGPAVRWRSKNSVHNAGLAWLTAKLAGTEADDLDYIAIGTGSDAIDNADTALQGSELSRAAASPSVVTTTIANDTLQLDASFAAGVGTGTVEEVGVFDAASTGTMFARALTGTKVKNAADALTVTYKIQFQRP